MQKMQTVALDDLGRLSVCLPCSFAVQTQLNGLRFCWAGDTWGSVEHCIQWETDPPLCIRFSLRQITLASRFEIAEVTTMKRIPKLRCPDDC